MKNSWQTGFKAFGAVLMLSNTLVFVSSPPSEAQATPTIANAHPSPAETAASKPELKLLGFSLWRVKPDGTVLAVPGGAALDGSTIRVADLDRPDDTPVLAIAFSAVDPAARESTILLPSATFEQGEEGNWSMQGAEAAKDGQLDLSSGSVSQQVREASFHRHPERIHRDGFMGRDHFRALVLCSAAHLRGRTRATVTLRARRGDLKGPPDQALVSTEQSFTIEGRGVGRLAGTASPKRPTIQLVSAEVWELLPNGKVQPVPGGTIQDGKTITVNPASGAPKGKQFLRIECRAVSDAAPTGADERVMMGMKVYPGVRTFWGSDDHPPGWPAPLQGDPQSLATWAHPDAFAPGGVYEGGVLYWRSVRPTESRVVGWWGLTALRDRKQTPLGVTASDDDTVRPVEQEYTIVAR